MVCLGALGVLLNGVASFRAPRAGRGGRRLPSTNLRMVRALPLASACLPPNQKPTALRFVPPSMFWAAHAARPRTVTAAPSGRADVCGVELAC